MPFRVTCPDGHVRHEGDFALRADAVLWCEHGHACESVDHHTFRAVPDPRDCANPVALANGHWGVQVWDIDGNDPATIDIGAGRVGEAIAVAIAAHIGRNVATWQVSA